MSGVVALARRGWDAFVGPEATRTNDVLTAALAGLGTVVAPLIARRRGSDASGSRLAAVLAADLLGGAYVNNTRACARWYERPGEGPTQHLAFAALHAHPAAVAWMDRGAARRVSGPAWALTHYAFVLTSSAAIQRFRAQRRPLGALLMVGGIALDGALGPSRTAPWFAWTYYPKLLLGHSAAALWSDRNLHMAGHGSTD